MANLKTNYKDDIFSGNRKYNMIDNGDGTVSFTDQTSYTQVGDNYGAIQINEQNEKINENSQLIADKGLVVSNSNIPVSSRIQGNLYFFYT